MRLIDANDFLTELKERHENIMQDPEVSERMKWCEAVHYGATTAIIEKMPTIEATPVVHGRWDDECRCTVCGWYGEDRYKRDVRDFARCPDCGAVMDGGVSDG